MRVTNWDGATLRRRKNQKLRNWRLRSFKRTRLLRTLSPSATLEDQLDSLLRSHGQNDLWQLAADLARKNFKPEVLEQLFATLDADTARAALVRISASVEIADLLNQIESSTSRISDLVGAIKEYTFMDQSPIQNVDIVKTLETTLTILNHKLKRGVTVQRDYQKIPLLVNSFGSELNQVWTNLIDNAIDAMGGKGELRVRTLSRGQLRCGGDWRQWPRNFTRSPAPHFRTILHDQGSGGGNWARTRHRPAYREEASRQYSGSLPTWRHAFSGVAAASRQRWLKSYDGVRKGDDSDHSQCC